MDVIYETGICNSLLEALPINMGVAAKFRLQVEGGSRSNFFVDLLCS